MSKRVALLLAGCGAFWVVTVLPAWGLGIAGALPYGTISCVICLLPALGTLLWADWVFRDRPDAQMVVFMAGTAIRMIFVGGAASLLYLNVAAFRQSDGFLIWVAIFYLFVLFLETTLIAVGTMPRPKSTDGSTPR